MAQPTIKTSFASGEWAPKLRARVDLQKYHAGAAMLRNFMVDYSGGGASTRPGTQFINAAKSGGPRLIPFQPSSILSFVLEFGQNYIRFYSNGAPVVEGGVAITGVTQANPAVVTAPAHGYTTGDEVFISGIAGMTQIDNQLFIITVLGANTFSLQDYFGNNINSTAFTAYSSGGDSNRLVTITSPYAQVDLFPNPLTGNPGLKFVQDVTSLIITHPNYAPMILTEINTGTWSLTSINFTPTIGTPTGLSTSTTGGAGTAHYAFIVTAVDSNNQESNASSIALLDLVLNLQTSAGITHSLTWTAVPGAVSYNVYSCLITQGTAIPSGAAFGFIANVTSNAFAMSSPGIAPDFAQGPPITPSAGSGVKLLTLTANANYAVNPTISIAAPGGGGITATGKVFLGCTTIAPGGPFQLNSVGGVDPIGALITFHNSVVGQISSTTLIGGTLYTINTVALSAAGSYGVVAGTPPATDTPVSFNRTGLSYSSGNCALTWDILSLKVLIPGSGYTTAPAVTFSAGAATATATLGPTTGGVSINPTAQGNPSVPGFYQQRLVLASPPGAIQTYYMSQPGNFFDFNISFPAQDTDAIQGTIISEELNDIRSLVSSNNGLIAFAGKGAWIINGGGGLASTTPITPADQTANPQAFDGANDLQPLKVQMDILYGTNKGNYVRDLSYNIYASLYTGSDITTMSNHLFFGYYLSDWCWSEEPFKTVWACRSDGQLLSLAYVKEQELVGWAHHDTDGLFTSCCSVIENVSGNIVDAVYFAVRRPTVNGYQWFIERQADRYLNYGAEDSWCVDAAIQTSPSVTSSLGDLIAGPNANIAGTSVTVTSNDGLFTSAMAAANWILRFGGGVFMITAFTSSTKVTATVIRPPNIVNPAEGNSTFPTNGYTIWQPNSIFQGLLHLQGKQVIGLADGVVVGPFTVSSGGFVTLPNLSTKVVLGLAFTPQLQTLPLDLGEPTVQSKRKKLPALTLRVADTLGLQVGTSFANLVTMKDFQLGAIPSTSNGVASVTDLVNPSLAPTYPQVDGRQILDQLWQEPGQICIQQNLPYPATIIGVIPEVLVGDTK